MNTKFETCLKLGSGCDRLRSYFRHHRSAVQIKPLAILETYFCKLPGYRKMPVVAQFCKVTVIDPKQKDGFEISFTIPKLSREDNVESKQKTMPNLTLRLWLLICILINGQISECHTYSRETVLPNLFEEARHSKRDRRKWVEEATNVCRRLPSHLTEGRWAATQSARRRPRRPFVLAIERPFAC